MQALTQDRVFRERAVADSVLGPLAAQFVQRVVSLFVLVLVMQDVMAMAAIDKDQFNQKNERASGIIFIRHPQVYKPT